LLEPQTYVELLQLVPLTGWLPVPLPSQIRCITVPGGPITHFEVSPCKQYLIVARKTGDPQLWHIMSNTLVGTFKGKSIEARCAIKRKAANKQKQSYQRVMPFRSRSRQGTSGRLKILNKNWIVMLFSDLNVISIPNNSELFMRRFRFSFSVSLILRLCFSISHFHNKIIRNNLLAGAVVVVDISPLDGKASSLPKDKGERRKKFLCLCFWDSWKSDGFPREWWN